MTHDHFSRRGDGRGRSPPILPRRLAVVLNPANYADSTVLDLAGPLAAGEIVLDQVVPARAPWSAVVRAGQVLTIVDVGGNQSGDCLLVQRRGHRRAVQRAGHASAWSGNVYVRTGTVLRSNDGNALATVVANEIDRQDTIGGACGKESNTLRYGHHTMAEHGCRENFLAEAAKYGMGARDIVSNLNWFMNVPVEADGTLGIVDGISGPGKRVAFRAEMDILVLVVELPADEQPVQRLQSHPAADDHYGRRGTEPRVTTGPRGGRSTPCWSPTAARSPAASSAPRAGWGCGRSQSTRRPTCAAPHVREADDAVLHRPCASARESYLRRRRASSAAAARTGAPVPSIPATASCRRTRTSRAAWRRRGSPSSGPTAAS